MSILSSIHTIVCLFIPNVHLATGTAVYHIQAASSYHVFQLCLLSSIYNRLSYNPDAMDREDNALPYQQHYSAQLYTNKESIVRMLQDESCLIDPSWTNKDNCQSQMKEHDAPLRKSLGLLYIVKAIYQRME